MACGDVKQLVDQLLSTSITDSKEVSFKDKALKLDTEKDASVVVEAITRCPKLEMLCLEGNTLGVDAAKAIGKALESCPNLKRALWKDLFTGRLRTEIPDAVRFLSSGMLLAKAKLTELDLSDNAFGPIGAGALLPLLSSPVCFHLEVLRLNNNGLGTGGAEFLAKALTKCIEDSTKAGKPLALRTLVCGRNRLENPGAIAMGAVFGKLHTLEEVALFQNGIYHEGIAALAKGLMSNKNLRILDLNDNTFTMKGARHMAQALRHLENLENINFGDCLLKTAGAKEIANSLKDGHNALKNVNLGNNEITLDGGLAIVEALKGKPDLETLELDGNKFGPEGVNTLEAVMEAVGKIEALCAFSDDEGVDDEEEEDDEEEGREEEGDSPVKGRFEKEYIEAGCSAEEFLLSPTAAKLAQLGSHRAQNLLREVESTASGTDLIRSYVTAFMKVASVLGSGEEGDSGKRFAVDCADSLLSAAFGLAKKENQLPGLTNEIVVNLGLIKAEKDHKVSWPASTTEGAMVLLAELVPKEYFASTAREALQAFLSKPVAAKQLLRRVCSQDTAPVDAGLVPAMTKNTRCHGRRLTIDHLHHQTLLSFTPASSLL
nr:ran GTPase-activating protein 1-like isoform X2 [Rhipicephalus microplus]